MDRRSSPPVAGTKPSSTAGDVRTPILNEAGTCQALIAASGQALVDRCTAMLEGLLTNEERSSTARGATLLAAQEASA